MCAATQPVGLSWTTSTGEVSLRRPWLGRLVGRRRRRRDRVLEVVHRRTETSSAWRDGPMMHRMDDNWLYIEGKRRGRPYTASVRVPFGPSRWPEYDHHVTVVLRYAPHWRTGLPKPKELTRLQDFEDRMIESLGDLGALVATETTDMRRT